MKNKTMNLTALIFLGSAISSSLSLAGVVGGGGNPPAIELCEQEMETIQQGVLRDEVIKITQFGHDEVYLKSRETNLSSTSISASDLNTGEEVNLELEKPIAKLHLQVDTSIANVIGNVTPGIIQLNRLPFEVQPRVETVPVSNVPDSFRQKLAGSMFTDNI